MRSQAAESALYFVSTNVWFRVMDVRVLTFSFVGFLPFQCPLFLGDTSTFPIEIFLIILQFFFLEV
jgi:hypothetical protein